MPAIPPRNRATPPRPLRPAVTPHNQTANGSPAQPITESNGVLYPQIAVKIRRGATALTTEEAQRILGWHRLARSGDRAFVDSCGDYIVCLNTMSNRPLDIRWCKTLCRDILNRRYRFNLENIILGRTGKVLDGQHRLIALVLASQEWAANPERWPLWSSTPTIDTLIAVGADESDDVSNTMGTGRPRTLTDVLSRSHHFSAYPERIRVALATMSNYAIRTVWDRTGVDDAYRQRYTTIAESVDFLDRHPRLCECAAYIHGMPRVPNYWPGYAAGFLYMMGSSRSDREAYTGCSTPDETVLDWSTWSTACEFWDAFCREEKRLAPLHAVLADREESGEVIQVPRAEKTNRIIRAWNVFVGNPRAKINPDQLLSQQPALVGGIDAGSTEALETVADAVVGNESQPIDIDEGEE